MSALQTTSKRTRSAKRRIFISYRRHTAPDAELASFLHIELQRAGHEVFRDAEMIIGIDWSAEISRRIAWCQYFIVLLSESAAQSEMVQEEVRIAHYRRKRDGHPTIFPVRVLFDGELSYSLGAYVGSIQHTNWTGPTDHAVVLEHLIGAINFRQARNDVKRINSSQPSKSSENPLSTSTLPPTSADPRAITRRPDRPTLNDPCYLERETDQLIMSLAGSLG